MAASDYEVFDERFRNCVNRTSHVQQLWTGGRWTEGPVYFPAGRFALFHTPEDLPERATTPDLLERVYHATLEAARILTKSA